MLLDLDYTCHAILLSLLTVTVWQVKVMCGTPEFVAPEVVNYDFIAAATGIS
jgi:hypothetical protein